MRMIQVDGPSFHSVLRSLFFNQLLEKEKKRPHNEVNIQDSLLIFNVQNVLSRFFEIACAFTRVIY